MPSAASRSLSARSGRSRSFSACSGSSMPRCSSSPSCSGGASSRTTSWATPVANRSSSVTSSRTSGTSCRPTSRCGTRCSRSSSSLWAWVSCSAAPCVPLWPSRSSGCSASGSSARAWACSSPAAPRPSRAPRARCSSTGCSDSWPGPGRHDAGWAGGTVPPALRRRPPPRASGAPSRRWPCGRGTGHWPRSCSCCRPTALARQSRAQSRA